MKGRKRESSPATRARRQLDSGHTSTHSQQAVEGWGGGGQAATEWQEEDFGSRKCPLGASPHPHPLTRRLKAEGQRSRVPPLKGELSLLKSPISFALSFSKGISLFPWWVKPLLSHSKQFF